MHNPTDRIAHTTAFLTPVVEHWLEREIAQWVHHDGSIRRSITSERVAYVAAAGFLSLSEWSFTPYKLIIQTISDSNLLIYNYYLKGKLIHGFCKPYLP